MRLLRAAVGLCEGGGYQEFTDVLLHDQSVVRQGIQILICNWRPKGICGAKWVPVPARDIECNIGSLTALRLARLKSRLDVVDRIEGVNFAAFSLDCVSAIPPASDRSVYEIRGRTVQSSHTQSVAQLR